MRHGGLSMFYVLCAPIFMIAGLFTAIAVSVKVERLFSPEQGFVAGVVVFGLSMGMGLWCIHLGVSGKK